MNVRALDIEDRNRVTGFGRRWHGKLSTSQRQAMRQERVDETFLGARDVPFTLAQTDLLAAHLAHQLSCTLKKRVEDDYVVSVDLVEPPAAGLEGTVELISNNLANRQALTLSTEAAATNSILSGKAHRIDGVLHEVPTPATIRGFQSAIVSRIKVMANLNIAEKRLPQDGKIEVSLGGGKYDLRVSVLPTPHGETLNIRILTRSSVFMSLEDLGFQPDDLEQINRFIARPHGIIRRRRRCSPPVPSSSSPMR